MTRNRVLDWMRCHRLAPAGCRIVAACSGGPDSLALVDLLEDLKLELDITVHVAHFDHGLRGAASLDDANFVRDFCRARELPFHLGGADVAALAAKDGGSVEETGRNLRYEYLQQVAGAVGGALIATGHHRDDQAETVLLNFLRGSGVQGLRGMRPRRGALIRPLLCLSRGEVELWCRQRNLTPRTDASNFDVRYRRNRIRHELLPLLAAGYNPAIADTLARMAEVFAAEHEFVHTYVQTIFSELVREDAAGLSLDLSKFERLPAAVQRELIRCMNEQLRGPANGFGFAHVELVRELFLQSPGTRVLDLPGRVRASRSYRELRLERWSDPQPSVLPATVVCLEFGVTELPALQLKVDCRLVEGQAPDFAGIADNQALFDPAALRFPLWLRFRRPGDRFQPLGSSGSRKLKELLIDLKIPAAKRDRVPLIGDAEGILWVVGYRRSERGKVAAGAKSWVRIEVEPFSGDPPHSR